MEIIEGIIEGLRGAKKETVRPEDLPRNFTVPDLERSVASNEISIGPLIKVLAIDTASALEGKHPITSLSLRKTGSRKGLDLEINYQRESRGGEIKATITTTPGGELEKITVTKRSKRGPTVHHKIITTKYGKETYTRAQIGRRGSIDFRETKGVRFGYGEETDLRRIVVQPIEQPQKGKLPVGIVQIEAEYASAGGDSMRLRKEKGLRISLGDRLVPTDEPHPDRIDKQIRILPKEAPFIRYKSEGDTYKWAEGGIARGDLVFLSGVALPKEFRAGDNITLRPEVHPRPEAHEGFSGSRSSGPIRVDIRPLISGSEVLPKNVF